MSKSKASPLIPVGSPLKWREDIWLRTPRQCKTGGWVELIEHITSGHIVAVVPWYTPAQGQMHDLDAVLVPAWAVTEHAVAAGMSIDRIPSSHMRRDLSSLCDEVAEAYVDETPRIKVASRYRVPQGRARASKEGGVRHTAPSEGADTIAIIPVGWFAQLVGVSVERLRELAYAARRKEDRLA